MNNTMNTYSYQDTSGATQKVNALNANDALKNATNLGVHSGVQLIPVDTTINAQNLANVKSANVPPPATQNVGNAPVVTNPNGTNVDANGNATVPPAPTKQPAPATNPTMDYIKSMFKSDTEQLATKGDVTSQLQEDNKLEEKTAQATTDYNAYNQAKLGLQQKIEGLYNQPGITREQAQQQDSEITRSGNANLANLAVIAQSSQGLLSAAQQTIKDKLDAQFTPIQENIDNLIKYSQLNANDLTNSEQIKLQDQINQKKTDMANVTSVADALHQSLLQNGAPQTVYSAMDKITNEFTKGNISAQEAQSQYYQAAGPYGVDKEKQLQIQKLQADIAAAVATDAAVNPDVLQGMLNVYKSTGVLPAFGMSAKSPLRAQFYAALGADGSVVTEANTNKTIRAGLTTAYKTQQNQLSANQTAIGTLEKQLDLAQGYSDKVNRTDSPLVAKYVLGVKNGVFGDPEAAALNNIVKTASYEFAKILSGSAASVAGVTVSSAADAESMLNSAMSKGQFNEVVGLMAKEAQFRLKSQAETLSNLEKDMNNVGSLAKDLKEATSTSAVNDPLGILK